MICDKCNFDMPPSCCVIGNYWDCSNCKVPEGAKSSGWGEFRDIRHAKPGAFAAMMQAEHEAWLDECVRSIEHSLWGALPKNEAPKPALEWMSDSSNTGFFIEPDPNCEPSTIKMVTGKSEVVYKVTGWKVNGDVHISDSEMQKSSDRLEESLAHVIGDLQDVGIIGE